MRSRGRVARWSALALAVVLVTSGCALVGRHGRGRHGHGHGHGHDHDHDAESPFEATGFFRTENDGSRWWLVTPDGEPFYSHGVNHVKPNPNHDRVTGICPYCEAVAANYPDEQAWADAQVERLTSWGFNTISAWSNYDLFADQMPYTPLLNMAGGDDWFAPAFEERAASIVASKVLPRRDDPNVVGWLLDNELRWGRGYRSSEPMLTDYLALPEGSPGRAVAESYVGDPDGFLRVLADRYYEVTTSAIRAVDPNHLVLGTRLISFLTPTEVVEEAGKYLDVLTVNNYPVIDGLIDGLNANFGPFVPVTTDLAEFNARSGLPIIVTEWSYRAADTEMPNTWPPIYPIQDDQQMRADAFAARVEAMYAAPWIVGDHWFEYVDQPVGGRGGDGEDNNFGLVNNDDEPYEVLTARMTAEHAQAPDALARERSDPDTCRPWERHHLHAACESGHHRR